MKQEILHQLRDYGLTINQANIYMACLQMGSAPLAAIIRHTGLPRGTVFSGCKKLSEIGLVTEISKNKITNYTAVDPQVLKDKLISKLSKLDSLLSELEALRFVYGKQLKVQFYEGFDGVKEVYNDIVKSSREEIVAFRFSSMGKEIDNYVYNVYDNKRIAKGIHARAIITDELLDEKLAGSQDLMREVRKIPKVSGPIRNDITLYGDYKIYIGMFEGTQPAALIIQSQSLHDTLKNMFEVLWISAKE